MWARWPRFATDCVVFSIIGLGSLRLATAPSIFAQRYPQVDSVGGAARHPFAAAGQRLRGEPHRLADLIYPGIFGKRCLSPPSSTQGCALSQKISIPGLTQLASSSVPAMIIVTFGMTSASSISVDPHSGQNRR